MRIHIGNLGDVRLNVFVEEKHKSIEYTTEFWRGFMLTTSSRAEEHRCDICGGKKPVIRDRVEDGVEPRKWHPSKGHESVKRGPVDQKQKAKNRAARKAEKRSKR